MDNQFKAMREVDTEQVFEELEELGHTIDIINDAPLILESAYENQSAVEGILENAGFYNISIDELSACEVGIRKALEAVNKVLERQNTGLEIVELDLCDTQTFMLVPAKSTAKKIAHQIEKLTA